MKYSLYVTIISGNTYIDPLSDFSFIHHFDGYRKIISSSDSGIHCTEATTAQLLAITVILVGKAWHDCNHNITTLYSWPFSHGDYFAGKNGSLDNGPEIIK